MRTGAILDLVSRGGYRAKEMPSLCSHFAFEHQTETPDKKCPHVLDARWRASPVVINNFAMALVRVTRTNRLAFHDAVNGVTR
jgi:hypothetical protein